MQVANDGAWSTSAVSSMSSTELTLDDDDARLLLFVFCTFCANGSSSDDDDSELTVYNKITIHTTNIIIIITINCDIYYDKYYSDKSMVNIPPTTHDCLQCCWLSAVLCNNAWLSISSDSSNTFSAVDCLLCSVTTHDCWSAAVIVLIPSVLLTVCCAL